MRIRNSQFAALAFFAIALTVMLGFAQSTNQQPIPDAPSATRPFPKPSVPSNAPPATPEQGESSSAPADQAPADQTNDPGDVPAPEPPTNINTVPPGGATKELRESNTNSRDELFTVIKNVNFVQVPVTVKDDQGHLIAGLLPRDFRILEDGQVQNITFFTSDPFPLSAAVVLDLGMDDIVISKVKETLPAMVGAFGQFDEVSLYTYGSTVQRVQGFVPAQNDVFIQTVRKMQKTANSRSYGVPVTSGPMVSGPTINGRSADPGAQATVNAPQNAALIRPDARVLNDAILEAALDLAARERTRRKVLFIISDGRELRSDASYRDVLKVLQTHNITVYGVGVDTAAIPGYKQLNKIRIPGQGYNNLLPKYAAATGGQVFTEFSRSAIETAYAQVTQEARNQYTIGYTAPKSVASSYRSIEVRVRRPLLKVYARDGYYPLPPSSR